MAARTLYVVEARNDAGELDFDCEQPPIGPLCSGDCGGRRYGWTENELADYVFSVNPDATLVGTEVLIWMQKYVNPAWRTRVKYW